MIKYQFNDNGTINSTIINGRVKIDNEYIDCNFKLRIGGFPITHTHEFYEIIIIKKNSIINILDGVKTLQSAPTCALVQPHHVHRIKYLEKDGIPEYYNIIINKYYLEEIASLINENYKEKLTNGSPYFACNSNLYKNALELLEQAMLVPPSELKKKQLILKNIVVKLLAEYFTSGEVGSQNSIVKKVLYAMTLPQNMQLKFHEIAKSVGYCPAHIIRLFAKKQLPTPNKKFMQIKLDYASSLLASTTYGILEISERIGIRDVSYFNKVFKKEYGVSPTVYRKNHSTQI